MKPNVVTKATARLGASLMVLGGLVAPAVAGDRALIDFLGYSQTGQYFAFTESGIQDGSGFPYANVFVLDVDADTWVEGSPFRVRLDDENASLGAVRRQALAAAQPTLDNLDITYPVDILALSGDGVGGVVDRLEFGAPSYGVKQVQGEYAVKLSRFDAPSEQPCADFTETPIKGFELNFVSGAERSIFRDDTIPDSRGCPLDYSLFAVVAPMDAGSFERAVVIVGSYPFGFEGPDRRFLAVPIGN